MPPNILEKYTAAIRDRRIVAWEPKTDEDSPLDMEMIYLLVRYATPRGLLLVSRLVRENYHCSDPWWHTAFDQEQSRMIESGMYLMLLL